MRVIWGICEAGGDLPAPGSGQGLELTCRGLHERGQAAPGDVEVEQSMGACLESLQMWWGASEFDVGRSATRHAAVSNVDMIKLHRIQLQGKINSFYSMYRRWVTLNGLHIINHAIAFIRIFFYCFHSESHRCDFSPE